MPLKDRRIALIGAGNMGEALLRGLLKANVIDPHRIVATGRRQERLDALRQAYAIEVSLDNAAASRNADIVVLAIKPQIFPTVLTQIAPAIQSETLAISLAAGISMKEISRYLGNDTPVIRAMPNTPAVVDAAATALSVNHTATPQHLACAHAIFGSVGTVTEVDENLMDAVTGLSGSGPAYVFLIIEALADAGVKVGLPRYQAQALAAQTVLGSAKLLLETQEHPGVLKDKVTSPGGTAIAGLHTLEAGGLRTTLINAVVAATQRSRELGEHEKPSRENS